MPGIAGCLRLTECGTIRAADDIVARILRVNAIRGVQSVQCVYRSDHLVAVNFLPRHNETLLDQPGTTSDGRYVLFLEGEVYNLGERSKHLDKAPPACELLLAAFLEKGLEFVAQLRGRFNIVIYDSLSRRLLILNDGFASRSMYHRTERGTLLFGSEKKSVLALMKDTAELDSVGLLQVFSHVHNIGSRTFIQGVHSLPAATVLEVRDGRIDLVSKPTVDVSSSVRLNQREAVERWCELLRKSVNQCVDGKARVALQLSGGLDSRAIACALSRDRRPFVAITRDAPNELESTCASAVADKLGLEHYTFKTWTPPSSYIPAIVWRTECALSYNHCRSITNHSFLRKHCDFLMGGQFGDISSGGHLEPYMLEPANRSVFRTRVFEQYALHRESLDVIFDRQFLDEFLPQVEHEFNESFDTIHGDSNAEIYQAWDERERQANFILRAGLVDRHAFESIYPFLDLDYYRFVRSLPIKWRLDQAMYCAVIYRLGPELRTIPNANSGLKLQATPLMNSMQRRIRVVYRKLPARRGKRLIDKLQPCGTDVRGEASRTVAGQLDGILRDFVKSEQCDGRVFNKSGIERLLNGSVGKLPQSDALLQNLATFAVGIPMFLHGSVTQCPSVAESYLADTDTLQVKCPVDERHESQAEAIK